MPYSALAVANYFIEKARQHGNPLTPMKLIKLVYLAHGWNLALQNKPLIEEYVVAWRYGPVINILYDQFKKFGNEEIKEFAPVNIADKENLENDHTTLELLNRIWDVYGEYTGIQLSNLTHEKNTPWEIAWNKQDGRKYLNHIIENSLIKDYFKKEAQK